MSDETCGIEVGSDNVFSDLGIPDADLEQEKVRLAVAVNRKIARHGLSRRAVADLFQIDSFELSQLENYRLSEFARQTLVGFLCKLED